MNTEAIERIKGYCCEVTQAQWDEMVKVADEVGVLVRRSSRESCVTRVEKLARYNKYANCLGVYDGKYDDQDLIPFPDFLAKLKGEEKWQPKAGEMVNGGLDNKHWSEFEDEYIAAYCGKHVVKHMTVRGEWIACVWDYVRPHRPTITRTEAEQLLNKRIID
jgi:hypothetical protein